MSKLYIVLTDIWHAILGMTTIHTAKHYELLGKLLFFYPDLGVIIPFLVVSIYMAYQALDDDDPIERVGDLIEYSIGMIIGSNIDLIYFY
jgi:hypothetical protein